MSDVTHVWHDSCDTTHVWNVSFSCTYALPHRHNMCDITNLWHDSCVTWLKCDISNSRSHVHRLTRGHTRPICVTSLMCDKTHMRARTQSRTHLHGLTHSHTRLLRYLRQHLTHSCVWRDLLLCVIWLIHFMCSIPTICTSTWRLHVWDMTPSCVWYDLFISCVPCPLFAPAPDAFIRGTWLSHVCDMTYSFHMCCTHLLYYLRQHRTHL